MGEDEVQHHETRLNVGVPLDAAVLRVGPFERLIDRLRGQVVDVPPLTALDHLKMAVAISLLEKSGEKRTPVAPREAAILAAKEVAGVYRDQIEERSLAFEVSDGFERRDWIVVHSQSSRMSRIMWWSSSIFEVIVERSDEDASLRKPACAFARRCP